MMPLIAKGGPLMWLLLGCSVLMIAVTLERYFHFHRSRVDVGDLLHGLRNLIRNRNYAEALHECAGTPGPVARVIHSAIRRHDAPRAELKEIVEESGQLEVPKLEKYLAVLLSISYIAPLIGLLGTVLGLVHTFVQIDLGGGFATASQMSKGVYESLISSAAGLVVAIPAFVFYSFLRSYSRTLMHDMERAGIEIVNVISDARRARTDIISMHPVGPEDEVASEDDSDGGEKEKSIPFK